MTLKKIFSGYDRKGGCAKTSLLGELAYKLSLMGYPVLFIDLDASGNAGYWFLGDKVDKVQNTIYEVIKGECNIKDAIINISENFSIIPSSLDLDCIDIDLIGDGKEFVLSNLLQEIKDEYIIIMDLQASLGMLEINALTASDSVIIPFTAEGFNKRALLQVFNAIEMIREHSNHNLDIAGMAITRLKKRSNLHKKIRQQITNELDIPIFESCIRESVVVSNAQDNHKTVLELYPKSDVAEDYRNLVDEFVKYMKG